MRQTVNTPATNLLPVEAGRQNEWFYMLHLHGLHSHCPVQFYTPLMGHLTAYLDIYVCIFMVPFSKPW